MYRHTFYKFLTALLHKTKISIGSQNALFSGWQNFSQFFKVDWDLSGIGLGGRSKMSYCKAPISDASYQRSFHSNKIVFPSFTIVVYTIIEKGKLQKFSFWLKKTVKNQYFQLQYSIIGLSLLASPTRMKEDSHTSVTACSCRASQHCNIQDVS